MPKKAAPKAAKAQKSEEEENHFLKILAITLFGKTTDKYAEYFKDLKTSVLKADVKMLFRTYVSVMFFLTMCIFIVSFAVTLTFSIYLHLSLLATLAGLVVLPFTFSVITFLLYYLYPVTLAQKRKGDIESNLPFAINHMAAIAGSGVPPRVMFKVISRFKEYGEISRESGKINRNIDIFGMDEMTSIKEVASKTPSVDFKDFLQGIIATVQTGGSLKNYLKEESEKALFDYRIKRDKYVQQLSVYADFYTALLIAAPLIFVVMMPILSLMQGNLFGMGITELINFGMIVLVALNVLFLMFLQLTQQKM
jgi:archaeal flagellar protein FlaJ